MAKEIEHKYLVVDPSLVKQTCPLPWSIQQGYLSIDPDCTIRLRLANWRTWHYKATLTVKNKTRGAERDEWEFNLADWDAAQALFNAQCKYSIRKNRYTITSGPHKWEIDEFLGDNTGLWLAEIELENSNEIYNIPNWCGQNVTDDSRYYNSNLAMVPFNSAKFNADKS
jgi:adenylate cyclase